MGPLKADVVVIGGGAAGSMCALTAAQRGLNVVLLEPNKMLGKKLRITGKGRCNVTNNCDIKTILANIPGDGRFLYSALNRLGPQDTMALFEALGVPLKTERGSRVFPVSDRSHDIANALERAYAHSGCRCRVFRLSAAQHEHQRQSQQHGNKLLHWVYHLSTSRRFKAP